MKQVGRKMNRWMLALKRYCHDSKSMGCAWPILYSLSDIMLQEDTGWSWTICRSDLTRYSDFAIRAFILRSVRPILRCVRSIVIHCVVVYLEIPQSQANTCLGSMTKVLCSNSNRNIYRNEQSQSVFDQGLRILHFG